MTQKIFPLPSPKTLLLPNRESGKKEEEEIKRQTQSDEIDLHLAQLMNIVYFAESRSEVCVEYLHVISKLSF